MTLCVRQQVILVSRLGLPIEDKDFSAKFNGSYWTVDWKWIGDMAPVLKCKVESYNQTISDDKRLAYEKEVERWIEEGVLRKWHEDVNEGLLPTCH